MSRRRRRPLWPKAVGLAVVAVLAIVAVVLALRLLGGAIRLARTDGGEGIHDPQFAESAETVTRPPELMGDGVAPDGVEDPSAYWNLGEQTPVDKTAEELSREAEAANP